MHRLFFVRRVLIAFWLFTNHTAVWAEPISDHLGQVDSALVSWSASVFRKSLFEWIWIWNCKCESILRCIWLLDKSKKTWGTDNNNSLSFSLFIMCFYHSHVINSKVFEFSLFSTKLKSIKAVKIDMIIWDKLRYPIFGWPNELTCWEIFIRIQKTLLILYEWIQYTHIV